MVLDCERHWWVEITALHDRIMKKIQILAARKRSNSGDRSSFPLNVSIARWTTDLQLRLPAFINIFSLLGAFLWRVIVFHLNSGTREVVWEVNVMLQSLEKFLSCQWCKFRMWTPRKLFLDVSVFKDIRNLILRGCYELWEIPGVMEFGYLTQKDISECK